MARCHPKEHDILKIGDRFRGKKIHYCPCNVGEIDPTLHRRLKGHESYRSLRHHCVFRWASKQHKCKPDEFFPITKEEFFLAMADIKASVISRKLNIGYSRNGRPPACWDTYHVWKYGTIAECRGTEPVDEGLVHELADKGDLPAAFEKRKGAIIKRSEDAGKCPFASLMTHSELTEKWFWFFMKNHAYFGVPEEIQTVAETRNLSAEIQGSNSATRPKEGRPIVFVRLKLFANQSLSRIADTEIIEAIGEIIKEVPKRFHGGEELYTLYDETIFVIPAPSGNIEDYIAETLRSIKGFTTNYYFEGNHSPATRLLGKDMLCGFDILFSQLEHTYYPDLESTIDPSYNAENVEAFHAKLCELCNMAEAKRTFWKFSEKEEGVHECLCENCYAIRDSQKKINDAITEGRPVPHGIGYKIAKWSRMLPQSRLCFLKIDLDMSMLSAILRDILLTEFPPQYRGHYLGGNKDEHIGFSIFYEFLNQYENFLRAFNGQVRSSDKLNPDRIDQRSGVSNEFQILDNFMCVRLDEVSDVKEVLDTFSNIYRQAFPQFWTKGVNRNGDRQPITLSVTISDIKYPFFEAWRYLNNPKVNWMNVLVARSFELSVNPDDYEELTKINVRQNEVSRFLHKLAAIHGRTRSDLLVNTEIFNNRRNQEDIFKGIMHGVYSVHDLLCFYKLVS